MGFDSHGAFGRRQELHVAWLDEREFIATARAIKALARELDQDCGPALDELVGHGLAAAIAMIGAHAGEDVSTRFLKCRSGMGAIEHRG